MSPIDPSTLPRQPSNDTRQLRLVARQSPTYAELRARGTSLAEAATRAGAPRPRGLAKARPRPPC